MDKQQEFEALVQEVGDGKPKNPSGKYLNLDRQILFGSIVIGAALIAAAIILR